jgi:hypothetical protein
MVNCAMPTGVASLPKAGEWIVVPLANGAPSDIQFA